MSPVTDEQNDELRTMVLFLLGMEGGPKGDGMPQDVFRAVLTMLRPRGAG